MTGGTLVSLILSVWIFANTCIFVYRNQSVAVILTLEITGIPELSSDRKYPWPIASFIEPTRSHMFEVRYQLGDCPYLSIVF